MRLLERDKLLTIEAGEDARVRRLKLTAAGLPKVKAAAAQWREAQKEFETTYGVTESAELRSAPAPRRQRDLIAVRMSRKSGHRFSERTCAKGKTGTHPGSSEPG